MIRNSQERDTHPPTPFEKKNNRMAEDGGHSKLVDKFTPDEIEAFRDVFHEFDRDGDETIDTNELGAVFAELGQVVPPEMIEEMILTVDTDQTGSIEFDEFLELMARKTLGEMQEELDVDDAEPDDTHSSTLLPEDIHGALEQLTIPQMKHRLATLKSLRLGLKIYSADYFDPSSPYAVSLLNTVDGIDEPTTPLEEVQDATSLSDNGGPDPSTENGDIGEPVADAVSESEEVLSVTEEEVVRVMVEHRLIDAGSRDESDLWSKETLAAYVESIILCLEALIFDEEGYIEVHCEDAEEGTKADDTHKFTIEDAARMEENVLAFQFKTETDVTLTTGAEAFALHHAKLPYSSLPSRTILPRLTDESLEESLGFLDLNQQSLNDRYVNSLAEVIRRDAMRESHPDPDIRCQPLIRHIEVQRNFISAYGAVDLMGALLTKGCLVGFLDISHNKIGGRAGLVPKGDAATHRLYGYMLKQMADEFLSPNLIAAAEDVVASGNTTGFDNDSDGGGGELNVTHPHTLSLVAAHINAGAAGCVAGSSGVHNHGHHTAATCDSCQEWKRPRGVGETLRLLLSGPNHLAQLRVLRLTHTHLTDTEVLPLSEAIGENGTLLELDLSHNDLGYQSALSLAEMLQSNGDLRVLNVGWNRLTAAGTNYLIEKGLAANGTLEEVDLSWTGVQDTPPGSRTEGGGRLLGRLIGSAFLKRVKAAHNKIGPEGAYAIAQALKANSSLVHLSLAHNPLASQGVRDIIRSLKDNTTLEGLDLSATAAGPSVKESRLGEEVEEELREVTSRRDAMMKKGAGPAIVAATWQASETYRANCLLRCPQCDLFSRTTRLHDNIPGLDHRLEQRQSDDPPSIITELRTQISEVRCTSCHTDQPLSPRCTNCAVPFCDSMPNGVVVTFASQADCSQGRYPSPPGPDRGYKPDDIPKTFHVVSKRSGASGKSRAKAGAKKAAKPAPKKK